MISVSAEVLDTALAKHGLTAGSPKSVGYAQLHAAFNDLMWCAGRRLLEALRVTAHQRTLQPQHIHNLAKTAHLLETPVCTNGGSKSNGNGSVRYGAKATRGAVPSMHGGHAGTVMTGSYFDPTNGVDMARYTAQQPGPGTEMFPQPPSASDGMIRYALPASGPFLQVGGGSGSSSGSRGKSSHWLRDDAVSSIIREFRARFAPDLRVSEPAKHLLRNVIEDNVDCVLMELCGRRAKKATGSGKGSPSGSTATKVTPDGFSRICKKHCLSFASLFA